jgi:alkylhydroperoxidase family enzyme
MKERMEFEKIEPAAFKAMLQLEMYVRGSGLDNKLLELIKIRASQINSCLRSQQEWFLVRMQ